MDSKKQINMFPTVLTYRGFGTSTRLFSEKDRIGSVRAMKPLCRSQEELLRKD